MQNILSLMPLRNLFFLLWGMSALASKTILPGFFWATMLCLPALVLIFQESLFLKSASGKRILWLSLGLLILHIIWAFIRAQYYNASIPETYWKDDFQYYSQAAAIADAWKSGFYPEIWKKGSSPYLGTLHVGYHRPLAALFTITGPSTLAGLLLNAVSASVLPLFAALASRYLWVQDLDGRATLAIVPIRQDPALITAVLVALHPNQFYWASYLMKDLYLSFVFMAAAVLLLGGCRRRSPSLFIAGLFLLPYLFTLRIYAAVSLVAGVALYPALHLRKSSTLGWVTAGIVALFMLCAYTPTGYRLFQQMTASLVSLAPPGQVSPLTLLKQMGSGIPALFMAPYAWLKFNEPSPMYGLYPGMWYLYLIVYPLGFAGLYAAIRKNIKLSILPITAFGLASLIFLTSTFGGNASRQRFYLEYVLLIFAGYGAVNPSRAWIVTILVAELAFAIGQVMSLQ